MSTIFENYTNEDVYKMVSHCFDTIEKTGIWGEDNFVYIEFQKFHNNNSMLSVSDFLNDLYREFAIRNNLCKNYHEYIKSNLKEKIEIPEYIMRVLRQREDLDENDTSEDERILNYSKKKIFSELCEWEGLLGGWDVRIKGWLRDIYGVEFE